MKLCTVAYVTEYSRKRLENRRLGTVLLVHSSGMYLQFDDAVLLLCDKSWGVLPIGIAVEDFQQTILRLKPQAGQTVRLQGETLVFPGGDLTLCPLPIPAQGQGGALPQKELLQQAAEELAALQKTSGLSLMVLPLILGRACPESLKQNPYFSRAYTGFAQLMAALKIDDAPAAEQTALQLLGLGVGLTPSADDVFLGMLYLFRKLLCVPCEAVSRFQNTLFHAAERRTNQISAAYLKAIIQGAPFERMERVYGGLCGEEPLKIEYLTQIGNNSGSEMLLGMLLAWDVCQCHLSKEEESR